MRHLLPGALFLPLLLSCSVQAGDSLRVDGASLQGLLSPDGLIEAYLGVPYAQPPVGELRWAPARPIEHGPGAIVTATSFAPACEQGPHLTRWYRGVIAGFGGDPEVFPAPEVSEDCLYLNIWRPAAAQGELPVIVYVHGGSNIGGWSYEPNYLGWELAREGVVVASVAYRLGVFGFFAHPELSSANLALQDLVLALDWLHDNAAALGIDVDKITLMGESAGASNITHLLAMPATAGRFQRLIHQSAGWAVYHSAAADQRRELAGKLQAELGTDTLSAMRVLPAVQVREAADRVFADEGYGPLAGSPGLPRSLQSLVDEGKLRGVDMLIGSNADEARMYLDPKQSLNAWLAENSPPHQHSQLRTLVAGTSSEVDALNLLNSALGYHCPSMRLAQAVLGGGGRSWLYYFARVRPGDKAADMGAYHGAELPYVFNTHDDWLPTTDTDRTLSRQMMRYWANFARSGDPNGVGLPAWPALQPEGSATLFFDSEISSGEHPAAALCQVINNNK